MIAFVRKFRNEVFFMRKLFWMLVGLRYQELAGMARR